MNITSHKANEYSYLIFNDAILPLIKAEENSDEIIGVWAALSIYLFEKQRPISLQKVSEEVGIDFLLLVRVVNVLSRPNIGLLKVLHPRSKAPLILLPK